MGSSTILGAVQSIFALFADVVATEGATLHDGVDAAIGRVARVGCARISVVAVHRRLIYAGTSQAGVRRTNVVVVAIKRGVGTATERAGADICRTFISIGAIAIDRTGGDIRIKSRYGGLVFVDLSSVVGIGVAGRSVGTIKEDGSGVTELLDLAAGASGVAVALASNAAVGHDGTESGFRIAPTEVVSVGGASSCPFDGTSVVMSSLVVTLLYMYKHTLARKIRMLERCLGTKHVHVHVISHLYHMHT